jgi:hypothetical protein
MKRVLLTVLGILFFAGITFGVLSVLHRPDNDDAAQDSN